MTSDTITAPVLTAQDVRALRNADALVFIHTGEDTGGIRAVKRAENSATGFEQHHLITARRSTVETYAHPAEHIRASFVEMWPQTTLHIQTLLRAMRTGQQFTLKWTRGNQSPVLDAAGLVRDELRVRVGTDDKPAQEFLVAVQVGLDNTARMTTGL